MGLVNACRCWEVTCPEGAQTPCAPPHVAMLYASLPELYPFIINLKSRQHAVFLNSVPC